MTYVNRTGWKLGLSLALALTLAASTAAAQHELRFSTTVEGAITFTGNTLGLSNATDENGQGTRDSIGTFIALDPSSVDNVPAPTTAPTFPAGTTSQWQDDGSSAYLDLPTNKDVDVLYAELMWGGSWNYLGENVQTSLATPVTLSFEDGASITVTPDAETGVTINTTSTQVPTFDVHYYIRSGVVTDFIQEHGPGDYTVSGVPATQDHNVDTLNAAGWTMVVAYQGSGLPARNMAVWVGAEWVDENDEVDFTVEGFCSPPAGPVSGQALISAIEGDANRSGDQALIAASAGGSFVNLSATNNPLNNFFASQINNGAGELDTTGTFGDRNHDAVLGTNTVGGRQGWDITGVELGDDELDNDQTSATLRTTSTSDSFVVTLVAMSVDVNAPSFDLSDAFSVEPTETTLGGVLDFTAVLTNDGTAVAHDVRFFLPLPAGLSLTSFAIDDAPGDASGNAVTTADLAAGVDLGDIGLGESLTVTGQLEVVSIPAPPAEASFATHGSISYDYVSCADDPAIATEVGADVDLVVHVPRLETELTSRPAVLTRGGSATWRIAVTNSGTAVGGPVTVSVALPGTVSYQAGSTTLNGTAVADAAGQMPFATARVVEGPSGPAGNIAAGETATIELDVAIPDNAPDSVRLSATVDPDGDGPQAAQTRDLDLDVTGGGQPACGNGTIEGTEECDDGDRDSRDGCSSVCAVEPGWSCVGEPSVCTPDQADAAVEPTPDAGGEPDMEAPDLGGDADTGGDDGSQRTTGSEACGCSAAHSSPSWAILLALGAVVLRRRRTR